MNRYSTPDEPNFDIPKPIEFIDSISLDEELQLIREQFLEEMAPIEAAWDVYESERAELAQHHCHPNHGHLLPMQILDIDPDWQLTALQVEFLQHLVFQGEIAALEAVGLALRPGFQTALERLQECYRGLSMERIIDSANLMWSLQQECEKGEA
jgi:hypothetical protein